MQATKYMCCTKHLSYEERLQHLKLPTLNYRSIRGEMTELYRIITGKYDCSCGLQLYLVLTSGNMHASVI